jgi:hypothetical protein
MSAKSQKPTIIPAMSDPNETSQANPHPVSSHRTPEEIQEDEAGPAGPRPDKSGHVPPEPKKPKKKEDRARQTAAQKSAHPPDRTDQQ